MSVPTRPSDHRQEIALVVRTLPLDSLRLHLPSPRVIELVCALRCVLVSNSCGSAPSSPSSADATITIGAGGMSPTEVRIKAWGHVMFVNNDRTRVPLTRCKLIQIVQASTRWDS